MLFIFQFESTVKYILFSESIKLFYMYINDFLILSKLISINSFPEINTFLNIIFHHMFLSYNASSKIMDKFHWYL